MTTPLLTLIREFDASLTRMDGEKDLQKSILERAHFEANVEPASFKLAAMAYHKDQMSKTLNQLQMQSDVLETLIGTMADSSST